MTKIWIPIWIIPAWQKMTSYGHTNPHLTLSTAVWQIPLLRGYWIIFISPSLAMHLVCHYPHDQETLSTYEHRDKQIIPCPTCHLASISQGGGIRPLRSPTLVVCSCSSALTAASAPPGLTVFAFADRLDGLREVTAQRLQGCSGS